MYTIAHQYSHELLQHALKVMHSTIVLELLSMCMFCIGYETIMSTINLTTEINVSRQFVQEVQSEGIQANIIMSTRSAVGGQREGASWSCASMIQSDFLKHRKSFRSLSFI